MNQPQSLMTPRERAFLCSYDMSILPISSGDSDINLLHPIVAIGTCYGNIHLSTIVKETPAYHERHESACQVVREGFRIPEIATAHGHGVYSLSNAANNTFLMAGSERLIYAWRWKDILMNKLSITDSNCELTPAWCLNIPPDGSGNVDEEVNCLVNGVGSVAHLVYSATGCGRIQCFDIDTGGQLITQWKAHSDSVVKLISVTPNELVSASEDGRVCVWDMRTATTRKPASSVVEPVQCLTPGTSEASISRPLLGNWISALTVDVSNPDWLICGGGPKLSLWSRSALKSCAVFDPPPDEFPPEKWYPQSIVCDDSVSACGVGGTLFQWDICGNMRSCVKTQLKKGLCLQKIQIPSASLSKKGVNRPAFDDYLLMCGYGKYLEVISSHPCVGRDRFSYIIL